MKRCSPLLLSLVFLLVAVTVMPPARSAAAHEPETQADEPSDLMEWLDAPIVRWSSEDQAEMDCTRKIRYSWQTRKKLNALYHQIYLGYYNLIMTYAYAGALTEQQKQTRIAMLKNYIQTFYNRNYQWCSEHEPDEWEEEWYNRD